jgi:hypothetical protein
MIIHREMTEKSSSKSHIQNFFYSKLAYEIARFIGSLGTFKMGYFFA